MRGNMYVACVQKHSSVRIICKWWKFNFFPLIYIILYHFLFYNINQNLSMIIEMDTCWHIAIRNRMSVRQKDVVNLTVMRAHWDGIQRIIIVHWFLRQRQRHLHKINQTACRPIITSSYTFSASTKEPIPSSSL